MDPPAQQRQTDHRDSSTARTKRDFDKRRGGGEEECATFERSRYFMLVRLHKQMLSRWKKSDRCWYTSRRLDLHLLLEAAKVLFKRLVADNLISAAVPLHRPFTVAWMRLPRGRHTSNHTLRNFNFTGGWSEVDSQ